MESDLHKYIPFNFIVRGLNVLILGRNTAQPIVSASCNITGQRFSIQQPKNGLDSLHDLALMIQKDHPQIWNRSVRYEQYGQLAISKDIEGKRWAIKPPIKGYAK